MQIDQMNNSLKEPAIQAGYGLTMGGVWMFEKLTLLLGISFLGTGAFFSGASFKLEETRSNLRRQMKIHKTKSSVTPRPSLHPVDCGDLEVPQSRITGEDEPEHQADSSKQATGQSTQELAQDEVTTLINVEDGAKVLPINRGVEEKSSDFKK